MKRKISIIVSIIVVLLVIVVIILHYNFVKISFETYAGENVEPIKIIKGKKIELPKIEKYGYFLEGWYNGTSKVGKDTKYYEDTVLEANWISLYADTYKVTFDSDGGSKAEDITAECEAGFILPVVTKAGYVFKGWYDGDTKIDGVGSLPCANVTLKAKWEAVS